MGKPRSAIALQQSLRRSAPPFHEEERGADDDAPVAGCRCNSRIVAIPPQSLGRARPLHKDESNMTKTLLRHALYIAFIATGAVAGCSSSSSNVDVSHDGGASEASSSSSGSNSGSGSSSGSASRPDS